MPKPLVKRQPLSTKRRRAKLDAATDAACVAMHNLYRDQSIDRVLCRPLDAMRVAIAMAIRLEQIDQDEGDTVLRAVTKLFKRHPDVESHINDNLRVALKGRKRGDLRKDRY